MNWINLIVLVGGIALTALLCVVCGLGLAVWLAGFRGELRK